MELRHLRYFVTAAEELHFARAAERLGIAPPTLTVQIQEIERDLSVTLFRRNKRSVSLTPAGEVFLVEARAVLERFAQAQHTGRRAGRGEIGLVTIGYVGSAVLAGVLQTLVRQFTLAWPDIRVDAREYPMNDLPTLVAEGQIDIGIVRMPMPLPRNLRQHVLIRDTFCLALPDGHPLAVSTMPIEAQTLNGQSFIVPEQGYGTREVGLRGGFLPSVISAPGSLLAVLSQVSLGQGVSVIPTLAATTLRIPGIAIRPLAGPVIPSEVVALFRSSKSAPATEKLISQIIAKPCTELSTDLSQLP
jgi:DNA-binding transcriptional LysR family regulator